MVEADFFGIPLESYDGDDLIGFTSACLIEVVNPKDHIVYLCSTPMPSPDLCYQHLTDFKNFLMPALIEDRITDKIASVVSDRFRMFLTSDQKLKKIIFEEKRKMLAMEMTEHLWNQTVH
jgi:hypothetical protein